VPGETQRTQFVDAIRARFPSLRIDDRMALAAGAPDGWFACLDSGLQALVRLRTGSIQMTDRQLVLAGQTTDEDMHAALPAELKAGANRACETEFKVALNVLPEPNFAWRAVRTANELVLEGDVPGADAKAELVKLAASLFPGLPVIDRMVAQPVTAPKWTRTAEAALKALARLRTGEALIAEQTLTVAGEAGDTARATAVKDILARGLPRGYAGREMVALRSDAMIWAEQEAKKKAEDDARRKAEDEARRKAEDELRRKADEAAARKKAEDDARAKAAEEARKAEDARKAEEARKKAEAEEARRRADAEALARATPQQKAAADRCTTLLASAARTGRITFGFDSAALEPQSSATLDKLVEIAKTCPDARIDISGHTDAVGSAEHNEQLSQQRAEAVVEYLAAKGVDRGRLTATGYGSTRPLVPNTTAANRAQNRRIEFTAKPR
jgi:OOP family OmpA-OmpF porin